MRSFRIPAVGLVAVIGLLSGCGELGTPTSTDRLPAIPAQSYASDSTGVSAGATLQLVELNRADTVVSTVEKILDAHGGKLRIGLHELFVPPGAVSGETRFVWTARFGKYVEMELHAYRVSDGQPVTQFNEEIRLRIHYGDFSFRGDPTRLHVVYLVDGRIHGRMEKISSDADYGNRNVTGRLRHFSIYSMAIE